jgi:hypothetical protein
MVGSFWKCVLPEASLDVGTLETPTVEIVEVAPANLEQMN